MRCHLHFLTGRAEGASASTCSARWRGGSVIRRDGTAAIETLHEDCWTTPKEVGDLTRIFCPCWRTSGKKSAPGLGRLLGGNRRQAVATASIEGGRLTVENDDIFRRDPVNLLRLFHLADQKTSTSIPAR